MSSSTSLPLSQRCSCYNHALSGTVAILSYFCYYNEFLRTGGWWQTVVQCRALRLSGEIFLCRQSLKHTKRFPFVIEVLQSDHIVHLKDGFCITLMHMFLLRFCTAKDFNVLHGLVYHVYIHLAVHKSCKYLLCLVIHKYIFSCQCFKVFIPNKTFRIILLHGFCVLSAVIY